MTKQSLDERIKHLCENYVDNKVDFSGYVKEIKSIVSDVITEVLPEKIQEAPIGIISEDQRYFSKGHNHAIDQFTTNLNNLLGEK